MISVLLAKSIADLSLLGATAWYLVKFLISAVLAFCAIRLGIKWRKSKDAKKAVECSTQED